MSRKPTGTSAKPLKRPTQDRAKFTVQAIFDALVRIWQRDGWARLTTRSVALETGIAVGTLYDYFPNKTALLSGYVRHCIESLLTAIDLQCVQPVDIPWQARTDRLVRLCCSVDTPELPWFHPDMLALETDIAEPKHHHRVYEELTLAWLRVFAACSDLPHPPSVQAVQALQLALWGGRRYALMLALPPEHMRDWAQEMRALCRAMVLTHVQPVTTPH